MTVIFSGYTAITPLGHIDMVPFLRRVKGNKKQEFSENERDAGVLALHAAGFGMNAITAAVNMSGTEVASVLAGNRSVSTVEEPVVPLKERRMAERVKVNDRLVHPDAPHGTPSGYDHWWCRCMPCTQERAIRAAAQRRKTAERKEARRGMDRPAVA
jgi:hypothetical protein